MHLIVLAHDLAPSTAAAHVSERALVLLLPTDVYSLVSVLSVVLTVQLVMILPARLAKQSPHITPQPPCPAASDPGRLSTLTSLAAFLLFWTLIALGLFGPRDPLSNLLPLTIFTLWWICFPLTQALFGDIWRWRAPATSVFRAHQPLVLPTKSMV